MSPADTARLLAKCAAYDRRTVGQADVLAWHEVLAEIDLAPALAAVAAHYRESTDWIMPAHIRVAVLGATGSATRLPSARPLRDAIAEIAVPFDELANRRGLAAARDALDRRTMEAGR